MRAWRERKVAGFGRAIDQHGLAVADAALQQQAAERGFDALLDGALQRARAVMRVVSGVHQVGAGGFGKFQ